MSVFVSRSTIENLDAAIEQMARDVRGYTLETESQVQLAAALLSLVLTRENVECSVDTRKSL